jgi:hypothetical protein
MARSREEGSNWGIMRHSPCRCVGSLLFGRHLRFRNAVRLESSDYIPPCLSFRVIHTLPIPPGGPGPLHWVKIETGCWQCWYPLTTSWWRGCTQEVLYTQSLRFLHGTLQLKQSQLRHLSIVDNSIPQNLLRNFAAPGPLDPQSSTSYGLYYGVVPALKHSLQLLPCHPKEMPLDSRFDESSQLAASSPPPGLPSPTTSTQL